MNKKLVIILILAMSMATYGQQLYVEYGATISSFDYKNSQGQSLDNLLSESNNYFGMGYRDNLNLDKTLFISIGATLSGYGAVGSDRTLDNYFEWDVTYLGINAGLDIKLFQTRDFTFYFKGSIAEEFLIRGNQTINKQVYDLVGEDEFNNNIFFVRGSLGMQYPISRNTALFANYTYGKTIVLNSGKNEETLKLNTHQFGIGFIISLPSCNCDF